MLFLELFTSNGHSHSDLYNIHPTICAQLTGTPHIFFVFMAIQDTTTINAIILVVNQLATFVIQLVNTWPLAIDNRQKDKGE